MPTILARIKAPTFPAREFLITDYGAVAPFRRKPDGWHEGAGLHGRHRLAIEACHAADGGRVVVPTGVWITGAIHLLNNVNLHVAAGATLQFSMDPAKYLPPVFTRWEGVDGAGGRRGRHQSSQRGD